MNVRLSNYTRLSIRLPLYLKRMQDHGPRALCEMAYGMVYCGTPWGRRCIAACRWFIGEVRDTHALAAMRVRRTSSL